MHSVNYEGPRQANGIVAYLLKRAAPASTELTGVETAESLKQEAPVIVVYAGNAEEWWLDRAMSKRDAVQWCHATDEAVLKNFGAEPGTITMIKDSDD